MREGNQRPLGTLTQTSSRANPTGFHTKKAVMRSFGGRALRLSRHIKSTVGYDSKMKVQGNRGQHGRRQVLTTKKIQPREGVREGANVIGSLAVDMKTALGSKRTLSPGGRLSRRGRRGQGKGNRIYKAMTAPRG